jgi:hypothetical protein
MTGGFGGTRLRRGPRHSSWTLAGFLRGFRWATVCRILDPPTASARSGGRGAVGRSRRRSARGVRDALPYPRPSAEIARSAALPGPWACLASLHRPVSSRIASIRDGSHGVPAAWHEACPVLPVPSRTADRRPAAELVVRWPNGPCRVRRTDVLGRSARAVSAAHATSSCEVLSKLGPPAGWVPVSRSLPS